MHLIQTASPSRLIVGSVLDAAKAPLERQLRRYDPQLYLSWNPRKNHGQGIWELRRRSNTKSAVGIFCFEGNTIVKVEYTENNFVNHVKDFDTLGYHILAWIKSHDLWDKGIQVHNVVAQAERNFDSYHAEQERLNKEQLAYDLKQHRREWQWLREYSTKTGQSVADIAAVWGTDGKTPQKP